MKIDPFKILPPESKNKILLVDDCDTIVKVWQRYLEHQPEFRDFEFIKASNGYEAKEIYKQCSNEIALIITGLIMPRMSGMELIDWIRKIDNKLPILVIAGSGGKPYFKLYKGNPKIITLTKSTDLEVMAKNARKLLKNCSGSEQSGQVWY